MRLIIESDKSEPTLSDTLVIKHSDQIKHQLCLINLIASFEHSWSVSGEYLSPSMWLVGMLFWASSLIYQKTMKQKVVGWNFVVGLCEHVTFCLHVTCRPDKAVKHRKITLIDALLVISGFQFFHVFVSKAIKVWRDDKGWERDTEWNSILLVKTSADNILIQNPIILKSSVNGSNVKFYKDNTINRQSIEICVEILIHKLRFGRWKKLFSLQGFCFCVMQEKQHTAPFCTFEFRSHGPRARKTSHSLTLTYTISSL